jgi:RNA polymerase sigma-70 factor, ECF subfamily
MNAQGSTQLARARTSSRSSHAVRHLRLVEDNTSGVLTGRFRQSAQPAENADHSRLVQVAVGGAKQGNRDALRYLYIEYADSVYGYVRSLLRDEHDAEDVTQQVFAKLVTILPKYEQREVPFAAWILRVARNVAVDDMRRRRALPSDDIAGGDGEGCEPRQEDALTVREALATLPPEQRQVLMLRHLVGLSPGEIAAKMGKTEASIHGLHHRGRSALKIRFRELGLAPSTAA